MSSPETITIASAVVVPTQDDDPTLASPPHTTSPTTLKRRAPSPPAASSSSPAIRRKTGADEEKKRGKRLFGALLGTIGKFQKEGTSTRARGLAVKRKEVEAKLQEKLKAQNEEAEAVKKREEGGEAVKKRVERREFEGKAMRLRHASRRAQAGVLATKATPKLFYLPWKLSPEEEDCIKAQIESVEVEIEREQREYEGLRQKDQEELRAAEAEEGGDETMEDADGDTAAAPDVQGDDMTADAMDTAPALEPEPATENSASAKDMTLNDPPVQADPVDDTKDIEDSTEAELITGEDTVIY